MLVSIYFVKDSDTAVRSGYRQRKSLGYSPEEPDARRSALEYAQYRS